MINFVVAFGLLFAIMFAYGALVREAPSKLVSTIYTVFFTMILVGASFPALMEFAPVLISWVTELFVSTKSALIKVM